MLINDEFCALLLELYFAMLTPVCPAVLKNVNFVLKKKLPRRAHISVLLSPKPGKARVSHELYKNMLHVSRTTVFFVQSHWQYGNEENESPK